MFQIGRIAYQRNFSTVISSFKGKINHKLNQLQQIELPERFKGTIVEKWKDYWKHLCLDYVEVGRDTLATAKSKPKRTAAILSLFGFTVLCFKTNPDEPSYRDTVISYSTQLIMIGPTIRNPRAKAYLEEIENYYNQGVLKRISFGLFSFIYKDNYNEIIGLYKTQCPYLTVPFYKYYEQIVDFGFMNKWHVIDDKMTDFDINPEEWL